MKQENGSVTFELILNLLLVALVVTGAFQFTLSIIKFSKIISALSNERKSEYILKNWTQRFIDNIDTYRFAIPPRIHSIGFTTFTDGSPLTLSIAEDSSSNAVSTIRVNSLRVFDVTNCVISSTAAQIRACLRRPGSFQASQYFSYLGIDAEKISSWTGRLYGNGRCRTFELRSVKSLVTTDIPTNEACLLHTLVPVFSEETIYLSNQHELRLLRTVGNRTIENQPLPSELKTLNFSLVQPIQNILVGIRVVFQPTNSKTQSYQMFAHLGRLSNYNFLLNS